MPIAVPMADSGSEPAAKPRMVFSDMRLGGAAGVLKVWTLRHAGAGAGQEKGGFAA